MKIINQDILKIERGIICHQVNCRGVMGSGLAKAIREKWPQVYVDYLHFYEKYQDWRMNLLGEYLFVNVSDNILVANIFGQYDYGYDKRKYTDYCALNYAFRKIAKVNNLAIKLPIYFPYNFGCDRGGGDWKIVGEMIDFFFPDAIVCKL